MWHNHPDRVNIEGVSWRRKRCGVARGRNIECSSEDIECNQTLAKKVSTPEIARSGVEGGSGLMLLFAQARFSLAHSGYL